MKNGHLLKKPELPKSPSAEEVVQELHDIMIEEPDEPEAYCLCGQCLLEECPNFPTANPT